MESSTVGCIKFLEYKFYPSVLIDQLRFPTRVVLNQLCGGILKLPLSHISFMIVIAVIVH